MDMLLEQRTEANTWKKITVLSSIWILLGMLNSFAQVVKVSAKVQIDRSSTCSVRVYKNGKISKRFSSIKRKCNIELQYDENYVIEFRQKGFRSKALSVNTHNVPEHMKIEDLDFGFEVSIDQPEPRNSEQVRQLIAHWFYHLDYGDFNYTYDENELKTHVKQFNEASFANEIELGSGDQF